MPTVKNEQEGWIYEVKLADNRSDESEVKEAPTNQRILLESSDTRLNSGKSDYTVEMLKYALN